MMKKIILLIALGLVSQTVEARLQVVKDKTGTEYTYNINTQKYEDVFGNRYDSTSDIVYDKEGNAYPKYRGGAEYEDDQGNYIDTSTGVVYKADDMGR